MIDCAADGEDDPQEQSKTEQGPNGQQDRGEEGAWSHEKLSQELRQVEKFPSA